MSKGSKKLTASKRDEIISACADLCFSADADELKAWADSYI